MKVKLSIGEYVDWKWENKDDIERMEKWSKNVIVDGWKGIREEYKKLSDIPEGYLPRRIFIEGFEEAVKITGSENPEYELDPLGGENIDIEWI